MGFFELQLMRTKLIGLKIENAHGLIGAIRISFRRDVSSKYLKSRRRWLNESSLNRIFFFFKKCLAKIGLIIAGFK